MKKIAISLCIGLIIGIVATVLIYIVILPPPPVKEQFQLTKEQQQQMESMNKKQMTMIETKLDQIRNLHQQLDTAFLKESQNDAEIDRIIAEIKAVHMELSTIHFQGLLETRKILSSEQFKQMIRMHQNRGDKKGGFPPQEGMHFPKGDRMPPPPF